MTSGTEDPLRPVGDEGGPQVGENTEGCEARGASKPTMFSTAKVASDEWRVTSGEGRGIMRNELGVRS